MTASSTRLVNELPGPQDLLLLPKSLDKKCETFLKEGVVAIRTGHPNKMVRHFRGYPTLEPQVDADGDVLLPSKHGINNRFAILAWPDGQRVGVVLWPKKYVSYITLDAMMELAGAGIPVRTIECSRNDTIETALVKYLGLN